MLIVKFFNHLFCIYFLALSACQPPSKPVAAKKAVEHSVKDEQIHQGDWPLIDGENPRTMWMDGVWGMALGDCHNQKNKISTLIMNYSDFNMEFNTHTLSEVLGPYVWQWSDASNDEPSSFDGDNDIKVIIYRATNTASFKVAKDLYAVDEAKQLDFRFVSYDDIIAYLNKAMVETHREDLAQIFLNRKSEIKGMFCDIRG